MYQRFLIEIVNGFTIGILIGVAWSLEARLITRIFFSISVGVIAVLLICIARDI